MTRPELADLLGLQPPPEGGWYRPAAPASGTEVLVSCVVPPGFDFADFRREE
jgi:predicted cupin superfamily sugar epimerase